MECPRLHGILLGKKSKTVLSTIVRLRVCLCDGERIHRFLLLTEQNYNNENWRNGKL